ncbi:hypothetical protein RRG08_064094 [Elysia crispata]|uniref:Uncharacterized protein n=1 Tax=Elysia crispata TaxID=231223 RepID=A0AAE1DK29_9GAST|nr:hypothetical protein RRG08_064094 [Elysia crispata]
MQASLNQQVLEPQALDHLSEVTLSEQTGDPGVTKPARLEPQALDHLSEAILSQTENQASLNQPSTRTSQFGSSHPTHTFTHTHPAVTKPTGTHKGLDHLSEATHSQTEIQASLNQPEATLSQTEIQASLNQPAPVLEPQGVWIISDANKTKNWTSLNQRVLGAKTENQSVTKPNRVLEPQGVDHLSEATLSQTENSGVT